MISKFKRITRQTPLLLLMLIIVSSCKHSESKLAKYGAELESVILTDTAVFRGLSLGDNIDSVKRKELGKPIEADSAYLYYEMKLDTTGSFNLRYTFDEDGLDEINSEIYIKNAGRTDEIFSKFKTYFDEHYGESISHQGYTVWTVRSKKFGVARINLSNESSDFTVPNAPGKLSLWIYVDKDNKD